MKIKFIRYNDKAEIPVRKHYSDTGADIKMLSDGCIKPGKTVVVPAGFGVVIPNGHTARLQVRTSIAKQGIMIQGCAIDVGYTGEISMIIHNISDEFFGWRKGDSLCYIEVYPVQYPDFVEDLGKERGTDAFGSTGI